MDMGTWKVVLKEEVPSNANVLGGRFVLAIKDSDTDREVWKARFVVQGYRDKMNKSLVHDNSNVRPSSVRMLVGLASIFGFQLFSTDVTQAYLQSVDKLMRDVYVKPTKEFELAPNQILKLLKPLYGLAESGEYWGKTISEHLRKELGMETLVGDEAVFMKLMRDTLEGMCVTYVDDLIQAGSRNFHEKSKVTENSFQCKKREYDNIQFAGSQMDAVKNGYVVHQKNYIDKLSFCPQEGNFTDFRSLRAKLSWLVNKRPDIAYSYASYANNNDASSQLGYIIFLTDNSDACQPLVWSSHKYNCVTRSVLGSETMALADAFDMAFMVKHDVQRMTRSEIPLNMITDSSPLINVITRASRTAEKRL